MRNGPELLSFFYPGPAGGIQLITSTSGRLLVYREELTGGRTVWPRWPWDCLSLLVYSLVQREWRVTTFVYLAIPSLWYAARRIEIQADFQLSENFSVLHFGWLCQLVPDRLLPCPSYFALRCWWS